MYPLVGPNHGICILGLTSGPAFLESLAGVGAVRVSVGGQWGGAQEGHRAERRVPGVATWSLTCLCDESQLGHLQLLGPHNPVTPALTLGGVVRCLVGAGAKGLGLREA